MQSARSEKWLHFWRRRNRQPAAPHHRCTGPRNSLHRSLSGRSARRRTLQGDQVVPLVRLRLLRPGVPPAPDHPLHLPDLSRTPQG